MTKCYLCGGRGSRVIAVISDPHWTTDGDGQLAPTRSFAIPFVVAGICAAKRAREKKVTA
jgi:hypothetical protein